MQNRRDFLITTGTLTAGLTFGALPAPAEWRQGRPGFLSARDIGEAGYIYGLPLVMNYGVVNDFFINKASGQYKGPFNTIVNSANVFTWKDTAVVTPNSDTPYSFACVDLRAEPMVISVPEVEAKRYFSVQLIDGNTYNFGYIGSRATGSGAGDFLVVGPGWTGARPEGVRGVFQSSTDYAVVLFRTQLFAPDDIDNVKAVQAGYQLRPLSVYTGQPAPAALPEPDLPEFSKERVKTEFFEFLDFALQFAPAQPNELFIREQLARIGVGPGKTFDFKNLSPEDRAEVMLGVAEGKKKIDTAAEALGTSVNGWRVASAFGNAAFFHGNWELRAAAAQAGIYGNDAVEAMYPMTRWDASGTPLDGSKNNYTMTFAKDQLPPVNAFWSVTMYDGKTQLLIQNPIDRYLINAPMLPGLKTNADGSLTLYLQHTSPGADKERNWLPAPAGPIYMVMRLYWPRTEEPSILPPGQGTWQPPGVVKAS